MTEILLDGRPVEEVRFESAGEGFMFIVFRFPDGTKESRGLFKEQS